jgi:hypothetical protein
MNKQETIAKINKLLIGWNDPDATNDAAAVFEQMPITLAEIEQMPITLAELQDGSELTFADLVRLAAHDVQRSALMAAWQRNSGSKD